MRRLLLAAVLLLPASLLHAQTSAPSFYATTQPSRDGIGKVYMGREIAHVMGHQGADWLERAGREAEERPNAVVEEMGLKETDIIADIGAGTGYFTFRMAGKVPRGKVLAVDIQPEMLERLDARERELKLANVEPVLGRIDDPKLPPGEVDVVLMVDAYHEFSHPREMMEGIVRGLKPGGRVVLVEYRAEDPRVAIKPLHKMSEAQAVREMTAVGLRHVETKRVLPRQHLMFFQKPAKPVGLPAMSTEPTGASAAFTSQDPIVQQALSLMSDGQFKAAQSLLASDDGHADAQVAAAREEAKEILRRVRRDYSADASEIVAKIRKEIPDVTAADLERWRQAGEVQARVIDGETKYFRREPSNLFRFSEEAKSRRAAQQKEAAPDPNAWTLHRHLANVIATAEKTGQAEVVPIRHRMKYTVTIAPDRPGARPGSLVRCWLTFPQEYRQQKEVKLVESTPADPLIAPNGVGQRTAYFEQRIDDPSKPISFSETFEYTSYAYYPILKDELAEPLPADFDARFLAERPPHIVFSPELKSKVAEIVGDETNPLAKARKIFHWISENIRYHAEYEYSTIPSFALACLSRNKGDCGVQGMLFVTMCRAAGVPARWQSGWESKRDRWNMHDWAEFYVEPWGWLPADPSYGVQKSDDPKIRDFYLGHQDSYRLIANLDYGSVLHPPKPSMRSEPADFQVGEIEIDGRNLFYDEWKYEMKMEWLTGELAEKN